MITHPFPLHLFVKPCSNIDNLQTNEQSMRTLLQKDKPQQRPAPTLGRPAILSVQEAGRRRQLAIRRRKLKGRTDQLLGESGPAFLVLSLVTERYMRKRMKLRYLSQCPARQRAKRRLSNRQRRRKRFRLSLPLK